MTKPKLPVAYQQLNDAQSTHLRMQRPSGHKPRNAREAQYLLASQQFAKLSQELVARMKALDRLGETAVTFLLLPGPLCLRRVRFLFSGMNLFAIEKGIAGRFEGKATFSKLYATSSCGYLEQAPGVGPELARRVYDSFHLFRDKDWVRTPIPQQRYIAVDVEELAKGGNEVASVLGSIMQGLPTDGSNGLPTRYLADYYFLLRLAIIAADDVVCRLESGCWKRSSIVELYRSEMAVSNPGECDPCFYTNEERTETETI